MIDHADRVAIAIMTHLCEDMVVDQKVDGFDRHCAMKILYHAIRHLAYPDRDIYPKVRGATKIDPYKRGRYERNELW